MTSTAPGTSAPVTGWASTDPVDDTLLRQFVHAWSGALAEPVRWAGGTVAHDDAFAVCDLGRPASFFNSAVLLQPPRPDGWDVALDAVERQAFTGGSGRVHLWSAWPTPDLTARDWSLAGHPPVLVRPPGGPLPSPAPGLEVREVGDARELRQWERVVVEGYPLADLQPHRPEALFGPGVLAGRMRAWVGCAEGEPAAAGASCVVDGLHVLVIGVVLPRFRGRGYWRSLLRTRLEAHPGLPCASLFSDLSRPGAQRHGFWPLSRVTLWTRERP
jgi:hypothetical protein